MDLNKIDGNIIVNYLNNLQNDKDLWKLSNLRLIKLDTEMIKDDVYYLYFIGYTDNNYIANENIIEITKNSVTSVTLHPVFSIETKSIIIEALKPMLKFI